MTAYEAEHLELEIKYCKKLECMLADLRQQLEDLLREATGEEVEEEERKGEKDMLPVRPRTARAAGMAGYVASGHDVGEVMRLLHRAMEGRSGVEVPRILRMAQEMGLLLRVPSYEVVRSEFGEIGASSGFYRGRDSKLTDKERQRYLMLLRG